MRALDQIDHWPAAAAAAVVLPDGSIARKGETGAVFRLASVTKLATAMAVLVGHEEGSLSLDDTDPHTGATVADLLAHCSGLGPDSSAVVQEPQRRRVYSTRAYDLVADLLAERSGLSFTEYLRLSVVEPMAMHRFELRGSPGADGFGSVDDLIGLARAWREPVLVHDSTLERARTPHLPELDGVLPGFGRQRPNPWGLGPEIRGAKSPHWTAAGNHPFTYGHFGQAGTMMWIDPAAGITLIALCDTPFGPWAIDAWPALSAAVLAEAVPD